MAGHILGLHSFSLSVSVFPSKPVPLEVDRTALVRLYQDRKPPPKFDVHALRRMSAYLTDGVFRLSKYKGALVEVRIVTFIEQA